MSHLICPMCGLKISLKVFDPQRLDLDIFLTNFRGLGRGLGFETSNVTSVLGDDEVTPLIVERVISLCKLFVDRSLLNREVLRRKLGLVEEGGLREYRSAKEDRDSLRSELEEVKQQLEKINRYNQDWQKAYNELTRQRDVVASERNKVLNDVNAFKEKISKLNREIDEYEAKISENSEFLEELETKIEDHLGEERAEGEGIKDYIEEGLDKLLEDIESLRADREDG
jgi:hypothetical protein